MKYSQSYIEEILNWCMLEFNNNASKLDYEITKGWLSMVINEMPNKTQLGKSFNVSPRTVGRAIERCIDDSSVDHADSLISDTVALIEDSDDIMDGVDDTFDEDDEEPEFLEHKPDISSWSIGKKQISMITEDGDTIAVNESHPKFSEIAEALISGDEELAYDLSNKKLAIKRWSQGSFEIEGDTVRYKGEVVGGKIIDYIVELFDRGIDFKPFVKFYEKLMANPSYRVVNQLFPFIQHSDININEDGDIVAWKIVTDKFRDCRTGTFDNSVGSVVEMERNQVDEDPESTCSDGLHLCAKHYLSSGYGYGGIVVKCLVSPTDVVAIPFDYNDSKMRCCRYKVIGTDE